MGKPDIHDEESWALLSDGTILTVDANNLADLDARRELRPGDRHVDAGRRHAGPDRRHDPDNSGSHEIGPEVLRPDGTVVAIGGNGHNALYDSVDEDVGSRCPICRRTAAASSTPPTAPPRRCRTAACSSRDEPGLFMPPTHFFELDGDDVHARSRRRRTRRFDTSYQYSCSCCRPARSCDRLLAGALESTRRRPA